MNDAKYIGMDVHQATISVAVRDSRGNLVMEAILETIVRVVDLPSEVDSSKVSAMLKDGVLKIELPKAAHGKAVRIEPKTA